MPLRAQALPRASRDQRRAALSARGRDLLLTAVMVGLVLTPAWLTPPGFALPWLLLSTVLAVPALWWSWSHAPWVPTPTHELDRVIRALALRPGQRFCDLGAGDGRVLVAVRRAVDVECVGVEAVPLLFLLGRLRLLVQGDARTRLRLGDLYRADLSDVDVVYVWGTAYSAGTPRFRELVRGVPRVVSYHTPLDGLQPDAVDEDGLRPLYTYESKDSAAPPT